MIHSSDLYLAVTRVRCACPEYSYATAGACEGSETMMKTVARLKGYTGFEYRLTLHSTRISHAKAIAPAACSHRVGWRESFKCNYNRLFQHAFELHCLSHWGNIHLHLHTFVWCRKSIQDSQNNKPRVQRSIVSADRVLLQHCL